MATTQDDKPVNNGVNVEALFGAQAALKNAPEAAKFKWRSTVEWINGTHSRSTIEGFYGLGAEQKHKKKFTFDADHPEVFAAEDHGGHAGGDRPGRSRKLPDRRRRGRRPGAQGPVALRVGDARGRDGHPRHPRHG